jgi:hypothetical protein
MNKEFKIGDRVKIPKIKDGHKPGDPHGTYDAFLAEAKKKGCIERGYLYVVRFDTNCVQLGWNSKDNFGYGAFQLPELEHYQDSSEPIHNYDLI